MNVVVEAIKRGKTQVFACDEMSLTHYLFFLDNLLLPELKRANHTSLSPPKTMHIVIRSISYFSLQYSYIIQCISITAKAYLLKLNSDGFVHKIYFLVIHLFRNYLYK